MSDKPSYLNFDKSAYAWKADVDYRKHPKLYKVGKGEQGVLICEPYKSELLPHWRFKNEDIAIASSAEIYNMFLAYISNDDFVGADMARKFLQMGFTRSRRYANYKGGKKYDALNNYQQQEKGTGEEEKAKAASVFYNTWKKAEAYEPYAIQKKMWKDKLG